MEGIVFTKKIFLLIFSFSLLTFFTHTYFTKSAIFADGNFYYASTRSIVKDFDIDFENDFPPLGITPTKTITGYTWNKYPPGVSFAWVPLFFFADGLSNILENIGISVDTNGFGIFYQTSIAISSISLGILALILMLKLLLDHFPKKTSYLTILTFFGTTNLLFYIAVEPINSHAVSFFISTLFIFHFIKHKPRSHPERTMRIEGSLSRFLHFGRNDMVSYYLTLGLLGGIAGLVRTQDLLILVIPAIDIFLKYKPKLKSLTTNYLLLTTGFLLGFLPQIYFWKKIFGTFWYSPYIDEGFNFEMTELLDTLFNSLNGLLYITPIVAISLIGLMIIWRQNKSSILISISSYGLFYFVLQLLLVTFWNPSIGGSFSNRMMITTLPLLTFGLAEMVKILLRNLKTKAVFAVIVTFGINNGVQIVKYLLLY